MLVRPAADDVLPLIKVSQRRPGRSSPPLPRVADSPVRCLPQRSSRERGFSPLGLRPVGGSSSSLLDPLLCTPVPGSSQPKCLSFANALRRSPTQDRCTRHHARRVV